MSHSIASLIVATAGSVAGAQVAEPSPAESPSAYTPRVPQPQHAQTPPPATSNVSAQPAPTVPVLRPNGFERRHFLGAQIGGRPKKAPGPRARVMRPGPPSRQGRRAAWPATPSSTVGTTTAGRTGPTPGIQRTRGCRLRRDVPRAFRSTRNATATPPARPAIARQEPARPHPTVPGARASDGCRRTGRSAVETGSCGGPGRGGVSRTLSAMTQHRHPVTTALIVTGLKVVLPARQGTIRSLSQGTVAGGALVIFAFQA